ncbi:hypothetical protein HID58_096390, partial [Brassica napus]
DRAAARFNGNNGEQGLDVGERGLGSDSGKSVGGGIKVTEVLVERSGLRLRKHTLWWMGNLLGLSMGGFAEGKKEMVTREGVTDKGNAKSPVREKSSYAEAVNVGTGTTAGPDFEIVDGVADIEIPTEIFEDVEPLWKRSDKEVVLKLLSDLEQIDAIVVDVNNTVERIEEGPMNGAGEVLQTRKDGEWTQNGKPSSPRENLQSQGECRVVSPNGFRKLEEIKRNEGMQVNPKRESCKPAMLVTRKDLFGDLPSRVKLAYEDLCLKQAVATDLPTTAAFEDVSAAWEHWHHISGIEEQFYFQKSKVKWLGLGDRNNCFYHNVCKARNSKNAIRHQLWFVKYEQRQDGLFVELATDNSERLSTRLKLFS